MDVDFSAATATDRLAPASRERWLLACLLLLAIAVRLIGIERPLTGPFATKNVVYAMIARNWATGRAPILWPTVDCLSPNERGMHLLEWPVTSALAAGGWAVFGGSLDVWGRGVSILFSLGSVLFAYALVQRWRGGNAALATAAVLTLTPASVLYGRAFMLEPSVACLSLMTLWAFDVCRSERRRAGVLLLGVVAFGLLLLTKIYMAVLLLPLGVMIWQTAGSRRWRTAMLSALLLASLPAVFWHMAAWSLAGEPENPVYYSLRRSLDVHAPTHDLLLSGSFIFRLLRDVALVGLTPMGLCLAVWGLTRRTTWVERAWLASAMLLVAALPLKFYELNYYQLVILPPLALLAGIGFDAMQKSWPRRGAAIACLSGAIALSAVICYRPLLRTASEDLSVLAAADASRKVAADQERIVAMHGTGIDLLYYCDRPGWAIGPESVDLAAQLAECRRAGARWLIVADVDAARRKSQGLLNELTEAAAGPGYAVFSLGAAERLAERSASGKPATPGTR